MDFTRQLARLKFCILPRLRLEGVRQVPKPGQSVGVIALHM
jgi:hypothetical protein